MNKTIEQPAPTPFVGMVSGIERYYSVQELAALLGVDEEQLLAPINSGELEAVNIAKNPNGQRPRWRISESAAGRFLLRRRHPASIQATAKPTRKAKEPKQYV